MRPPSEEKPWQLTFFSLLVPVYEMISSFMPPVLVKIINLPVNTQVLKKKLIK